MVLMHHPGQRDLTSTEAMLSGSLAGVTSRLITAPLDVVKIRLQLQLEPIGASKLSGGYYTGWRHAMKTIAKEEGPRALFKGNLTADLLYICYGAVQFGCYNEWKKLMGEMSPGLGLLGGSLSAVTATMTSYPLDILKTRLATQGNVKRYTGLYNAMRHMYINEGPRGFYRGLSPTLIQIIPYMGLQFSTYERMYRLIERVKSKKNKAAGNKVPLDVHEVLLCGAVSGSTSKFIVLPLDCMRKRLQVVGFEIARSQFGRTQSYGGLVDCALTILSQEGFRGFFKGGVPAIIKALVASSLTFGAYDQFSKTFRYINP